MATATTPAAAAERVYPLTAPPTPKHEKLGGYDFYRSIGSPKNVLAPMVEQSELPWRLLSKAPLPPDLAGPIETITTPQGKEIKRFVGGVHLSYTPMVHAKVFLKTKGVKDPVFNIQNGEEGCGDDLAGIEGGDRPLFVQFCANDPDVLLAAAKKVEDRCDAVDINFGCPQGIARKGHYGSFLQDEWELISRLISTLHENLKVPVTAKFRIFPNVEKTVAYAKMIEAAGAQILTCHGRTREMKGQATGLADWDQIKAVKAAVKVPVFANGNILYGDDATRCMEYTGVDGVMSAEGNLSNPALFMPPNHDLAYPNILLLARRYLDISEQLKTPTSGNAMKSHMFRVLRPILDQHDDLRDLLSRTGLTDGKVTEYRKALDVIEARMGADGSKLGMPATPIGEGGYRELPTWVAQPYIRKVPESAKVPTDPAYAGSAAVSAVPSRAPSPVNVAPPAKPCIGQPCGGSAAARCPTGACVIHCRAIRAAEQGPMSVTEALDSALRGGLVGMGCEFHEAKFAARNKRKKEKNAMRQNHKKWKRGVEREERRRSQSLEREAEPQAIEA
ncbi:Dus-domain-containing protein [Cutaneotrichosporon oleaginosum]|uniref:tRNA-dihydrouridine(16/17) synthase [NAD(P)(+)] n=1 Tax=Cutaneotrichosporon oleaginosum TaxID=879819 RepID=A0A0J0XKM5_9TREE|nr:Dus-domain-containing protein [Cutaneotrichosporon oleaginosum]KLT41612.1 Dus-domain-containing protein [Cutaneotrichosporon oleaginosum]TXT08149.1 hypothetical protein COLE_05073 [Cutaneotrichosporon oleaginosum]